MKVTINSDDPPMFGSDITNELDLICSEYNYSDNELEKLTSTAVDVSFLSNNEKKKYSNLIKSFWEERNIRL